MKKYDIFISYRRTGGESTALIIRDSLIKDGYSVFLDVESLRSGNFNTSLLDAIKNCKDFILICSPNALDRCKNEDDWVRQELQCAIENHKNIIPILLRGFTFPDTSELPESIQDVVNKNGIEASTSFFDSFIKKLETFLKSSKRISGFFYSLTHHGWKMILLLSAVLLLVSALGFGGAAYIKKRSVFPYTKQEENYVDRLLTCCIRNLGVYDTAVGYYCEALNTLEEYYSGESIYQWRSVNDIISLHLSNLSDAKNQIRTIDEMDHSLLSDFSSLSRNPLNIADINGMSDALIEYILHMEHALSSLMKYYEENNLTTDFLRYIKIYKKELDIDCNTIFYTFNESCLPITNEDALYICKTDFIPQLTHINKGQGWIDNQTDLDSIFKLYYNQEEACLKEFDEGTKNLENQLSVLIDAFDRISASDSIPIDTDNHLLKLIQESEILLNRLMCQRDIASILTDYETASAKYDNMITDLTSDLETLKMLYEKACEKFRPAEEDDPGFLWAKGLRCISLKMYDIASECFTAFSEKEGTDAGRKTGMNAVHFCMEMEKTGVTGGSMMYGYESGLTKQDIQIGDIIYAVNGRPFGNTDEFVKMRDECASQSSTFKINILRFSQDGTFSLLETHYDMTKGRIMLYDLNESKEQAQ